MYPGHGHSRQAARQRVRPSTTTLGRVGDRVERATTARDTEVHRRLEPGHAAPHLGATLGGSRCLPARTGSACGRPRGDEPARGAGFGCRHSRWPTSAVADRTPGVPRMSPIDKRRARRRSPRLRWEIRAEERPRRRRLHEMGSSRSGRRLAPVSVERVGPVLRLTAAVGAVSRMRSARPIVPHWRDSYSNPFRTLPLGVVIRGPMTLCVRHVNLLPAE